MFFFANLCTPNGLVIYYAFRKSGKKERPQIPVKGTSSNPYSTNSVSLFL